MECVLGVPTGGSQRGVAKVLNNPRVFGAYAYLDDCYWALILLPTNIAGMGPAATRMMAPLRNFGARRVCQEPSFHIQGPRAPGFSKRASERLALDSICTPPLKG